MAVPLIGVPLIYRFVCTAVKILKGGICIMDIRSTDPQAMEALLKTVSGKLGVPPEQLRNELMQGKFDNALKNMKPDEAKKFNAILSNPKMLEKFMSAPQAQALYNKLTGGK